MDRLNAALVNAWRRTPLSRRPAITNTLMADNRTQLPDPLPPRALAIIGNPAKWAVLACPCGHRHEIRLNLNNPRRPTWNFTDGPTLQPSIDVDAPARRCHFWLTNGRVHWC